MKTDANETATKDSKAKESECCSAEEKAACCEPSEKQACCGPPAAKQSSCGCR